MTVPSTGSDESGNTPGPDAPLDPFPNAQVPSQPTPQPPSQQYPQGDYPPQPYPPQPYPPQPPPSQGYPQQPYPQHGYPQYPGQAGPYGHFGPPKPRMGKAITALVLGLSSIFLCICWFLTIPMAVVSIILGVLAQRDVKRGTGGGNGMAIAGMVLGIVGVIFGIIAIFIWLDPAFQDSFWDGFCAEEPDSEFCRNR